MDIIRISLPVISLMVVFAVSCGLCRKFGYIIRFARDEDRAIRREKKPE